MDDEAIRDLVNDAGLDWHTGFTLDEDEPNRYVTLVRAALAAQGADTRPCTCHPDDNPPRPCPRKFALGECRAASEAAQGAEPAAWIAPTSLDWHSVESERIVKVTQRAQPQRGFTTPLYAAPLTAQGATRIDPMQDPMRPTLAKLGPSDEHPAEEVLRKLACWLGVGGYNAPTVDADLFHRKIVAGIEDLRKNAAQPAPGWIACSERMPPNDAEPVLAIIAPRRRYYLLAGDVMNRSYATSRITHWMPLPEPPETLLDVAHRLIEAEAERISARARLERDKGSEQ